MSLTTAAAALEPRLTRFEPAPLRATAGPSHDLVLLVTPHPDHTWGIRRMLMALGYTVLSATSGERAYELPSGMKDACDSWSPTWTSLE